MNSHKRLVASFILTVMASCSADNSPTTKTKSNTEPSSAEDTAWTSVSDSFTAESVDVEIDDALAVWRVDRTNDGTILSKLAIEMHGEKQIWQFRLMNYQPSDKVERELSEDDTIGFNTQPSGANPPLDPEKSSASRDGYISFERRGEKIRGSGFIRLEGEENGTSFHFEGPIRLVCADYLRDAAEQPESSAFCHQQFLLLGDQND